MNKTMLALAAAALVPSVATAQSVVFAGADVSYNYQENNDEGNGAEGFSSSGIRGAVEVQMLGQFTAQLDLASNEFDAESDDPSFEGDSYTAYAIHAGYLVSPGAAVGLFYGEEDWDNEGNWASMGLEGSFASGQTSLEGVVGTIEQDGYESYDFFRADVGYEVMPNLSVIGDFTSVSGESLVDDGTLDVNIIGAGARYELAEGFYAEGALHSVSGDVEYEVFGIEIGYAFAGGTTFSPRDHSGLFAGF